MADVEVGIEQPHAAKQFRNAPDAVQDNLRTQRPILADDPQTGIYISFNKVYNPDTLPRWTRRLGFEPANLYKIDLPDGWRALYTVTSDVPSGETLVLIIEIVDHKEYERLMGY